MKHIYQSVVLDKPFIYRPITRSEYEGLRADNDWSLENLICQTALIDPEWVDWDNIEAGVPSTLSKLILRVSGYGDINYINNMIATEVDRVTMSPAIWLDSIIQHVYPHCTDEYLGKLTQEETITLYAKALYAYRFLENERVSIQIKVYNEIAEAQQKHKQQGVPKTPKTLGSNIYNSGTLPK